jgi:hypothetical protein
MGFYGVGRRILQVFYPGIKKGLQPLERGKAQRAGPMCSSKTHFDTRGPNHLILYLVPLMTVGNRLALI